MNAATKNRAFTLSEVLVSFTVLLIATAMMVALFVPSMSLFRRQTGKSDTYRNCLMMMEKFQLSVMNSQIETMTVALDGQALGWQEVEETQPFSGTTGDARMSPDFGIIFYDAGTKNVYYTRAEGAGGAPDEPAVLSYGALDSACSTGSRFSRVMARDIVEFTISDRDGNLDILEPPLKLTIVCEVDTRGTETNDVESFRLVCSAAPRSRRW